jgi:magnesium-transporting ATPase (P-type)
LQTRQNPRSSKFFEQTLTLLQLWRKQQTQTSDHVVHRFRTGWKEGVSILISLVLLVLIQSWNDWMKDHRFVQLTNLCRDDEVTVVRGKMGAMQKIDIWELVVGDVIMLDAGDKVPADCIIIES